jgi:hypothetical protein
MKPLPACARIAYLSGLLFGGRAAVAAPSLEPYVALSADGRYDDYIPGGREGFVMRIAPAAGGRVHTHRLVLRVDATLAYDRYEDTVVPVADSWNAHANANADIALTRRWQLVLQERFTDARDPREIDRIAVVSPPGVEVLDNSAAATVSVRATHRLTLAAEYDYRYTHFGDAPTATGPVALPGSQEHDLSATAELRWHPRDHVRLGYQEQRFVIGSGAETHSPSVGYGRVLIPHLRVELDAGPLWYSGPTLTPTGVGPGAPTGPGTAMLDDGVSATWRGRAALILDTPRWRGMASFDRALVGGTGAAPVIWADFAAGSLRYRARRWLDLVASGDYFRSGLPPDGGLVVAGYDASAEIALRLHASIELAGYYGYRDQTGHAVMGGAYDFRRDVAGLRLTALFAPTPRMREELQ